MVYRFWKPDGRISSYDSIWNWAFAVPLKISSIFLVFELPGPGYHWKVLVERLLTASGPWGSNRRIKWYASLRIWTRLGHWKKFKSTPGIQISLTRTPLETTRWEVPDIVWTSRIWRSDREMWFSSKSEHMWAPKKYIYFLDLQIDQAYISLWSTH